jgi:regulator of protease activity HflC (stomatin/prohibitin superfamily)
LLEVRHTFLDAMDHWPVGPATADPAISVQDGYVRARPEWRVGRDTPVLLIIFIVIGLVLIVAAGVIIGQSASEYGDGFSIGKGVASGALILGGLALIFVGFGWREVGAGQVGVKTRFGAVQEGTLQPGLHWIIPAVDGITVFDGRVQAYNFEEIESVTRDLQSVQLSGLINFRIDSAKADRILQEVGQPTDYALKVFLRPSNTALKEITPEYDAFNVISKRDEIGQRTLANLRERMEEFNIIVERVSVENIRLNDQFLTSVEAKQIAEQDLARSNFEADRDVRLAEGARDARITRAQGEAQANDLINASLSEPLLQWTYIQRLADNVQLMLVPSDQGLIFDLGAITETEGSSEPLQPLPQPVEPSDESS